MGWDKMGWDGMGWDGMGYTLKSKQFYNGWMGDWTGLDTPF